MELEGRLMRTISRLEGVTPYGEMSADENQATVLFRVSNAQRWLQQAEQILHGEILLEDKCLYRLHLCKYYLIHEGRLRHLWHLAIRPKAGAAMADALDQLDLSIIAFAGNKKPGKVRKAAIQPPKPAGDQKESVEIVPLVASGRKYNEPHAPLLQKGSRGVHLIRSGGPQ